MKAPLTPKKLSANARSIEDRATDRVGDDLRRCRFCRSSNSCAAPGLKRRASVSRELAGYLEKARSDSMRRKATEINEMAQVKIFNGKFYSVAIDANGDGHLDIPLVMSFPAEQGVEFQGPFPQDLYLRWKRTKC